MTEDTAPSSAGSGLEPLEDPELERLADEVEARWGTDPESYQRWLNRGPARAQSVLYWVAGGSTAMCLAIYPIGNLASGTPLGVLPALLALAAIAILIVGYVRSGALVSAGGLAVGVASVVLASAFLVVIGLDAALTRPGLAPPLYKLEYFGGAQTQLVCWLIGVLGLYCSWLMSTHRRGAALFTIPILGAAIVFIDALIFPVASLWIHPFTPVDPAIRVYLSQGFTTTVNPDPASFIAHRAIEVAAILGSLRLVSAFSRLSKERQSARTQSMSPDLVSPTSDRTNTLAILSLVFAVVGTGIVPVLLGHIARSQIKRTHERGSGLALAGLIIGYVSIGAAILIIAAGAVLPLMH